MDLNSLLPVILPKAIAWCEGVSLDALANGSPLKPTALEDALGVGVLHPENIRVLVVDSLPSPDDALLAAASESVGFLGPTTAGLSLGYAILVKRGHLSRRLLSHECRHVAQFEATGSLARFLTAYLGEIAAVGYDDCSFEVDARERELPNASLTWRPV